MRRISIVAAVFIFATQPPVAHAQVPAPSAVPATGTFDRKSIVVAFYRSPLWDAILAEQRYEMKAAKAANDTAKVNALETWGADSQNIAMQQLAGQAPIDNILAVLQPELKELKSRMRLSAIVESTGPGAKSPNADVTTQLLDWLRATPETRRMVADLHEPHPAGK
jgi:hypothetical protein